MQQIGSCTMEPTDVARGFIAALDAHDRAAIVAYFTSETPVSGSILPGVVPALDAFATMDALVAAFPDIRFTVQDVALANTSVLLTCQWYGKHTRPLHLPKMPLFPATHRRVFVPDRFAFTIVGRMVTAFRIDSPVYGGIPEVFRQLGLPFYPSTELQNERD